jgi:GDP-mannose transporter
MSHLPPAPATGLASLVNNGPVSIFSYCVSSILMTVTNKFVVNGFQFNMNFVLLLIQSLVCTAALGVLKAFGIITYRPLNKTDAKSWAPISVLLVIMIYTSSKALQFLSIPVYTIFKNLTIILIAYGEVIFFGGQVSSMALGSFILMVLSSVIACLGDQDGNDSFALNIGYFWMFTNCVSSAAFVLYMRKRIKLTNFKDFDTMYYNNVLSVPILLISSLLLEDWSAENLTANFSQASLIAMVVSGLASVGISYCSGWCVRVTSSTTYSMVGALNKLPIALSGLIFFEAAVNFLSISSIFIGFLAGLVYAVAKQQKK